MNNKDFWDSVNAIIVEGFTPEGLQKLDELRNNLSQEGLYINDFHRRNSMAAQREVLRMLLHPCSREQKLMQIELLHKMSADSKGNPLVRETAPQACGQKKSNTIIPLTIHRERDRREICKPTD
ncbi:MAG: hypothetical protein IKZ56_02035 [Bacteroidales bacterium]|nr:hypothetical protein [Bacteroidales bacterium]